MVAGLGARRKTNIAGDHDPIGVKALGAVKEEGWLFHPLSIRLARTYLRQVPAWFAI
jgi:hypothetical protein